GLVHGTIYWVLSNPNQFALQGDNRASQKQVIKLGKLENEVRGGLTLDIGAPTGQHAGDGFTLSAVEVLDSNFATFGVLTAINASDSATASAGISSADNAEATFLPSGTDWAGLLLGPLAQKMLDKYKESVTAANNAAQNQGSGGASASINLAGALAFSFTD